LTAFLAQRSGDLMRLRRLSITAGLALISTGLLTNAGQTAPLAMPSAWISSRGPVIKVGEREKAAAVGAIVGGAVGVLLGSTLNQPPPPPVGYAPVPPPVVEDEEPAEEVVIKDEEVTIQKRPARRVVEVEEQEAAPRVVEEDECLTRRTTVYDPNSGETIVRRERDCR
jgi:hypothetical protein